jgi:methionyl-tRNA formyltransferase
MLKIWAAYPELINKNNSNEFNKYKRQGQILFIKQEGIGVQTGDGVLVLTEVQRAGGKRLAVADFLRGCPLQVGDVLGHASDGVPTDEPRQEG